MSTSSGSDCLHVRRRDSGFDVVGPHTLNLGEPIPDSEQRNGVWAQWEWNGRELVVRHDPGGFRPIYYFTRPGEIAVAPSLVTLLRQGAPRELDDDALAAFFRLGFFLGDDTPFRAIRAVPANTDLRWTGEGIKFDVATPQVQAVSTMDRKTAIARYQELFSQAIHRRPSTGASALPLSGGRDSRHILFELVSQGHRPALTVTIARTTDSDGAAAAAVARTLGVDHQLIPAPPPSLESEQRKNVQTDFCADEHTWFLAMRGALTAQNYTLYDGIGGDVLSAGLFLEPNSLALFRAEKFVELARRLIDEEQRSPFIARFLTAEVAQRFNEDRAVARLAVELEKHAAMPNPCGSFYFSNRTRREIALSPFAIFGDLKVHAPYLDVDLVDFLSSLPAEMLLDHTFHDDTIAQAYPQWAHLSYSQKRPEPLRFQNLAEAWRLRGWLRSRTSASLNHSYLLPRLLRASVDPFYNRRALASLMTAPVYWSQLDELARG